MQVHPRQSAVSTAADEIRSAISDAEREYGLTTAELLHILSSELQVMAKYAIRDERHPNDPDKPGGLA